MLWVFKTELVGNFRDVLTTVDDFSFGNINHFILNMLLCRFSRFLFNQITKIVGR